jgi:hypothetical protein
MMKKHILSYSLLFLFILLFSANAFSQNDSISKRKDRDWRIEVEPSSFVFHGYNLHISRNITKDNKLNIGLYVLALDVPSRAISGMFKNVPKNADVRLGFEGALVARYNIPVAAIDPYFGLVVGWEYFDISQESLPDVRITTGVITPFIGHEIFLFRQMLFINPQLRGVFYVMPKSSLTARPEAMERFFVLPALSVGVNF